MYVQITIHCHTNDEPSSELFMIINKAVYRIIIIEKYVDDVDDVTKPQSII